MKKKKTKNDPISRSGRFASGPDREVAEFTQSITFDWRLWRHDITGSIVHATVLREVGLLTLEEEKAIVGGLQAIGEEIVNGKFRWNPDLEDVHMNIEAELTRRVPAGAKLHTGRSRNDQVALDLRMWLRDEMVEFSGEMRRLQSALVDLAAEYSGVIIPGYTHLQRAQPVYFAHHLLAYVEMLDRDHDRLVDCLRRVNICPLGSGALAGSTLPLNRARVAEHLGFVNEAGEPIMTQNSMDAVSDRDFAIEFCSMAALVAMHLSRLAEDWILWATTEFQFIRIGDAYTTGSSLMPQKKNPDVAELARGKTGRVYGNLMALLTMMKGLPMTYNRDLQEDKERLFDTVDTVRSSVRLIGKMVANTVPNEETCRRAAGDPGLLATDVADYLVRKGVPFREAHHAVGRLVALAEKENCGLNALTLEQYESVDKRFGPDVLLIFDLERAMSGRLMEGAPGTREVQRQLGIWKRRMQRALGKRVAKG